MKSITLNENNTQITIDGKEYFLVPNDIDVFNVHKEPELKTFEDCWNKIKPAWFISSHNGISSTCLNYSAEALNHLPTYKTAKQIQAAIKLFVVWQALLQTEYTPNDTLGEYYVQYDGNDNRLFAVGPCTSLVGNPYPFKSHKLAQKAIDIANDIFLEYFGIENDKS